MAVTMLSETRERFAKAILAQVPQEQIEEIHFFQPIRQGGVESGVAVLAVALEVPASDDSSEPALESRVDGSPESRPAVSPVKMDSGAQPLESRSDVSSRAALDFDDDCAIPAHTVEPPDEHERPMQIFHEDEFDAETQAGDDFDSSTQDAPLDAEEELSSRDAPANRGETLSSQDLQDDVPIRPTKRYTVFSARYRLVLKGPDRGKWEMSVRAEADAPLPTVDAVVRGVLRRAGDAEDAERMTGKELLERLPTK